MAHAQHWPDYIIIGAMKCGTSTLAAQLGAQEGVFMTTPKEPNFFSDDDVHAKGLAWYQDLFATAHPDDLKGEASTHYTKLPTHPETLARLDVLPATPKIIYLIRNPLDRVVSHYIHEWSQGVISTPLEDALNSHPELIDYGRYGMQLAPWVARFGVENVLVLSLEEMKRAQQDVLDRVGSFLGTPNLHWVMDLEQMNVSAERIRRLPLQSLLVENALATWLRRTLIPQGLRDRVKAARQMQTRPALSEADRLRLIRVYSEDFALLKTTCPDALNLDLAYPFVTDG